MPGSPISGSALVSLAEYLGKVVQTAIVCHLQVLHDDRLVVIVTMGPGRTYGVPCSTSPLRDEHRV